MYISTDIGIGIGIDHFCNALELCAMGVVVRSTLKAQKAQRTGERDVPWNCFVVFS